MTTVSTPHSKNQSTTRCKSVVKVPKLRTGSVVLSAFTAAMCMVAPTSIAAAFGWTTAIVRRSRSVDLFRLIANPPVKGEGLGCAVHQFPKRDRRTASPLSRAQQPMDHVFCGVHATKKPSAAPFHQEDRSQPFLRPQADAVRDGFFERDLVPLEEPPDRRATAMNLELTHHPDDLVQRQVGLQFNQCQQKVRVRLQRRRAPTTRFGSTAA